MSLLEKVANRDAFDLTGSELLRLEERRVKCHKTTPELNDKLIGIK